MPLYTRNQKYWRANGIYFEGNYHAAGGADSWGIQL